MRWSKHPHCTRRQQPASCQQQVVARPRYNIAVKREDRLDEAFERLRQLLPAGVRPVLAWLHSPRSRLVRIPLGALFIFASFFWFLPVVGLEFFPIGLMLIAQDVPFLRRPAGEMTHWLLDQFERLRDAWRRWRKR